MAQGAEKEGEGTPKAGSAGQVLDQAETLLKEEEKIIARKNIEEKFMTIPGIGPSSARKLASAGFQTFEELGKATAAALREGGLGTLQIHCILNFSEQQKNRSDSFPSEMAGRSPRWRPLSACPGKG